MRGVLFIVVTLGADAIEEFAASAKIETEVEIMGGLGVDLRLGIARRFGEKAWKLPRSNRAMSRR